MNEETELPGLPGSLGEVGGGGLRPSTYPVASVLYALDFPGAPGSVCQVYLQWGQDSRGRINFDFNSHVTQ